MGLNKHPFGRYQIIDRELCRREWIKTNELVKIISDELSLNVSARTINEDINAMKNDSVLGYFAPIEVDTRNKAYYYTDKDYTIKAFGLKEGDINALKFYSRVLDHYREYEVFKDFSGAIEKVLDAVKIRTGMDSYERAGIIVQTEQTPKLTGGEAIPQIVQALNESKQIQFDYTKYDGSTDTKLVQLEPYLLKEDRHRWYVLGRYKNYPHPTTTYALDRMSNIIILEKRFTPIHYDFEEYFRYSFGITVTEDAPLEVILSFTPLQGMYIKSLPIHRTQQILEDNETELRIAVTVRPSYEFYEKIMGYGDSVHVISPESVISTLRDKITSISDKYFE